MEKKTIEEVRKFVKSQNYELLSTVYVGAHTKMEFRCPEKHETDITWSEFQQGTRCSVCAGNKKKTFKEVKEFVESQGYELLSKEYINAGIKMEFRCTEKHEFEANWSNFQGGQRCPVCAGIRQRKTIEEVRKYVEEQCYELLSKEYINAGIKMEFRCTEKHEFKMTWDMFQQGCRCPICAYINKVGSNSPNWKGGITKDPYCEIWGIKDFKEMIKARDGYKCMNPCCLGRGTRIDVHHINYNKLDCDKKNLISICNSCNPAANKDREWHQAWYQAIMYMRYSYMY